MRMLGFSYPPFARRDVVPCLGTTRGREGKGAGKGAGKQEAKKHDSAMASENASPEVEDER